MPATRATAALAKLSPPRLGGELARERLFAWLDGVRGSAWIGAAPGSGKTVLVASWLQARGLRALWYRFDVDDNDAARFFATLGQAVDALGVKARRPAFAVEHAQRPEAYARQWFRAVFAHLARPAVLVLDNLEQAALPGLPDLLAVMIDEAPEGVGVIVTSRDAPPPTLARALLSGALAVLPPGALDFDADEVLRYAQGLGLDAGEVARVAQRVRGWAAGLRLLSHARSQQGGAAADPTLLFDYLAALLHAGLAEATQGLLLVAALLPWVPADLAAQLSGVGDAQAQLDTLCAHHLFVERVATGVYRLHPLWREFLLERGRQALEPGQRRALVRRAALGFAERGDVDAALDLSLEAGDHESALALLADVLEARLATGQVDQLAGWLRRLPPEVLDSAPALRYGWARLCFLCEDAAAPAHYEAACAGYAARGDVLGQQLCAAGMLEWSYNSDSFIGHRRWIGLLRRPLPEGSVPSRVQELRLLGGQLLARFFAGDFEADAEGLIERVLAALAPHGAENDKLSAAVTLLGCLERQKRWEDARRLAAHMLALLETPGVGPRLRILVRQQIAADLHRQCGEYVEQRRLAALARTQARELGFAVLEYEGVALLVLAALYEGEAAEARQLLGELGALGRAGNVYHERFAAQVGAWFELQHGRLLPALAQADALRSAVARSDMPEAFRATWLLIAILARFAAGDEQGACDELAPLCGAAEPGSRDTLAITLATLQAARHLHAGRADAAAQALADAWARAARIGYYQLLAPLRTLLAQLAGFALARGIAVGFAHELIARRRLRAPSTTCSSWPWPLRVVTLGRFELLVDGTPLRFARKVPRKPLALLKALIALGPNPVAEGSLADALWPDEEGDAARAALGVALHRLRRLLPGGNALLHLQDGRLALDAQACWVDARAFEDATAAGAAADPSALRAALALYRGHFLADEGDAPWAVSARERLRNRFRRAVLGCAEACRAAGREEDALDCWRQGIEIDGLDEAFYQGLMRSALALGRAAEGLAAYQQLQRLLSLVLGVAPSAQTDALRRRLLPSV